MEDWAHWRGVDFQGAVEQSTVASFDRRMAMKWQLSYCGKKSNVYFGPVDLDIVKLMKRYLEQTLLHSGRTSVNLSFYHLTDVSIIFLSFFLRGSKNVRLPVGLALWLCIIWLETQRVCVQ